ncbi:MAG TPA: SpoIIE family protein phosphatase, partial [Pseudonocardia sp.]|nr:SpoIIE family protein phosphatase [Pseudonocardia sp.]
MPAEARPTAAGSSPGDELTAAAWNALDACAEGVTILDLQGTVLYVNPASAAMADRRVEDSLGINLWQEYPDLVGSEFYTAIQMAAAQDEPVEWSAYYGPMQGWYTDRAQRVGDLIVVVYTRNDEQQQAEATRQRLTAQVQAALARSELLLAASEELARATSLDDVASRLQRLAQTDLAPSSVGLYVLEPDGEHLRRVHEDEIGPALRHRYRRIPLTGPLPVARAVLTGQAAFYDDRASLAGDYPDLATDLATIEVEASAVVPVRGPDGVVGAIVLMWKAPRRLDVSDRAVITTLAGYAGTAVSRVQRAAERLAAVESRYADTRAALLTMQRSLLPDLPVLPTVELVAHYVPADAHLAAGGDWYDAVPLPGGRLALVVGDVVGHGPPAAAAMAQLRAVCEHLLRSGTDLPEVLAELDVMAARTARTRAATVCIVDVDATGGLRWASHGHPPPVLVAASCAVSPLPTHPAPPLGTGGEPAPLQTGHLDPGDVVLLMSDGLLERPGRDVTAGLAELGALDVRLRPGAAALAEFTTRLIEEFGPGGAGDDLTLLAARRRQAPVPPLHLEVPGEPRALVMVRRALADWLEMLDIDEDDLMALELTAVEAVTNSIEHAYRGRTPGPVRVTAELDAAGTCCI